MNDSKMKETFPEVVDAYLEAKEFWSFEGEHGIDKFATMCRDLGNKYYQHSSREDIFAFFMNNSGAVDAMIEWIKDNTSDEEQALLAKKIPNEDEEFEDEYPEE